jgi:hemolysin D
MPPIKSVSSASSSDAADVSALSDLLATRPHQLTHRLLYTMLALTVLSLAVSAFWEVDVVVSAPAVLVPDGRPVLLQSETPLIVRALYVREGDLVEAGQRLAEVESDEVGQLLFALAGARDEHADALRERNVLVPLERTQLRQEAARLRDQATFQKVAAALVADKILAEERNFAAQEQAYRLELAKLIEQERRIDSDIDNGNRAFDTRSKELDALLRLRRDQFASEVEVLMAQRARTEAQTLRDQAYSRRRDLPGERDLIEAHHRAAEAVHSRTLLELRAEGDKAMHEQADAYGRANELAGKEELREQEATRKVALAEQRLALARQRAALALRGVNAPLADEVAEGRTLPGNRLALLAPVAGRVGTVSARGRGETVGRGQALLSLLPDGVPLLVELRIPDREAGRAQVGQPVKVKLDAYPFADYGVLPGEVRTLAPEAEPSAGGGETTFRAFASLDQPYYCKNGQTHALRAGMAGTAEVVVETRTLLRLLLRPLIELKP